jgi:hypothetical protein
MAIAGRRYPNVPVIIRGSLEDPADFGSRTRIVIVAAQPPRQAPQRAVIIRGALQDAPVLVTPRPVVVAAVPDRRRLAGSVTLITGRPGAPPSAPAGLIMASFL